MKYSIGTLTIRLAQPEEASEITALALRSKAHWGYTDQFMAACREELTYSPAQIADRNFVFYVWQTEEAIAGFYAIQKIEADEAELDALFVEPKFIGHGFGRALMDHAITHAAEIGVSSLIVQSDPHAEAFYLAAGAVQTGVRESSSIAGRQLPLFTIPVQKNKKH